MDDRRRLAARGALVRLAILLATGALLAARPSAAADARCAGDGPWVQLQLGAQAWSEAQRASVLSDLQHTLAGQGIAACSADAHPTAAALATLSVDLAPDDTAKATVDIEVRDAVTRKRVRRDVDLSRIPDDGRAAAIAIEADELLRASWAEIALDTARAREAQEKARPQVVGSVQQVLAPARGDSGSGLGARAAIEHYFGGITLAGADGVGRVGLAARLALEIAGTLRLGPSVSAPHGQVSALAAGGSVALLFRIAGSRRGSLAAGAGVSASWLEFRAQASPGADASTYANLLAVGNLQVAGRLALGRSVHASLGAGAGVALRGVEATDAGTVVAQARGFALGATVGLESP
jgi:hypothetical protein